MQQSAGLSFMLVLFYLFTSSALLPLSLRSVEESYKFGGKKHSTNAVLIKDAKYVIFFFFLFIFIFWLSAVNRAASCSLAVG